MPTRRPLVVISGVTQELPTADDLYIGRLLRQLKLAQALIPSGAFAETFPRGVSPSIGSIAPTSGKIYLSPLYLFAGESVSSLTFMSGTTTGGAGMTHYWVSLWSSALGKLAVSADDTTATWAITTTRTTSVSYTASSDGLVFAGYCGTASTSMPQMEGMSIQTALDAVSPAVSYQSTATTYTDPASAPSSLSGAVAANGWGNMMYAYAS